MKTNLFLKIAAIIVIILGTIHCCVTPIVIPSYKILPKDDMLTAVYMFFCTGLALILVGWIQYYITKQQALDMVLLKILRISAWFIFIIGAGAAILMPVNPFAYISLLVALFEIIIIRNISKPIIN